MATDSEKTSMGISAETEMKGTDPKALNCPSVMSCVLTSLLIKELYTESLYLIKKLFIVY